MDHEISENQNPMIRNDLTVIRSFFWRFYRNWIWKTIQIASQTIWPSTKVVIYEENFLHECVEWYIQNQSLVKDAICFYGLSVIMQSVDLDLDCIMKFTTPSVSVLLFLPYP